MIFLLVIVACFAALLMICFFLRADVERAVKAKEDWRSLAIRTDIDRQNLSERVDRMRGIIRDNNDAYQEMSDELEDAELELSFARESLTHKEQAITFWIGEFNNVVDEWHKERQSRIDVTKERDALTAERNALAFESDTLRFERDSLRLEHNTLRFERSELEARCKNIARTLGVSDEDSRQVGLLWGAVCDLKGERDTATRDFIDANNERNTLKALNEGLTADLFAVSKHLTEAINERDALKARPDFAYEIAAVAEAIRQGHGFVHSFQSVGEYLAPLFKGPLSPDVSLIVSALDDLKSDLISRMARLRAVQAERDNLRDAKIKPTRGPVEDIAPPVPPAKRSLSIVGRKGTKGKRQAVG